MAFWFFQMASFISLCQLEKRGDKSQRDPVQARAKFAVCSSTHLYTVEEHPRQHLVHDTHVFREPVEDATRGVGVEETHRRRQDIAEHLVVEPYRAAHAHPQEHYRSENI